MIYQLQAYYGAVKHGIPEFSIEFKVTDAKNSVHLFTLDEKEIQAFMREKILASGYNPDSYEYRWLTQEEYDRRPNSVMEKHPVKPKNNDQNLN